MKKIMLFVLVVFLLVGCMGPREPVRYDPKELALVERDRGIDNQMTPLIDGMIIGGGLVFLISLIGFAVFYFVGKKS